MNEIYNAKVRLLSILRNMIKIKRLMKTRKYSQCIIHRSGYYLVENSCL